MHEEESEEEDEVKAPQRSGRAGAAIAPPMSLVEQDKTQAEEKGWANIISLSNLEIRIVTCCDC